jgi:hypothetical protein
MAYGEIRKYKWLLIVSIASAFALYMLMATGIIPEHHVPSSAKYLLTSLQNPKTPILLLL